MDTVLITMGGMLGAALIYTAARNAKRRPEEPVSDLPVFLPTDINPWPVHRVYAAARAYDLSLATERYRRVSGAGADRADRVADEFRRFFALVVGSGTPMDMVECEVDAYWHELICCTALYREFCQAIAGRFIDHEPDTGGDGHYHRTWQAYRDVFGMVPDQTIWPVPGRARGRGGEGGGCSGFVGGGCSSGSSVGDGGGGGGGCGSG